MALAACAEQLTVAREHAVLGEYDAALAYFEGVLQLLERCARARA